MTIGKPAALSIQAIRTAAALPLSDPKVIARRLYAYGSAPRTPQIDVDFGPGDNALAVLGLTSGGGVREHLLQAYEPSTHPGWVSFWRAGRSGGRSPAFKLYVSPRPEALATAFPILARTLAALEVRSFKVGRGVPGLLRPDKIVAYFDDAHGVTAAALALGRELSGCPAQGVPFTAEIDPEGLLSWAMDPPPRAGGPPESWRSWVTARVASAILAVRRRGEDPAPAVLHQLATEDVRDWLPPLPAMRGAT